MLELANRAATDTGEIFRRSHSSTRSLIWREPRRLFLTSFRSLPSTWRSNVATLPSLVLSSYPADSLQSEMTPRTKLNEEPIEESSEETVDYEYDDIYRPRRRIIRGEARERRRSSIVEQLPETPQGWAVLLTCVATAMLAYEVRLQRQLSAPPLVYGQYQEGLLRDIYEYMNRSPESILRRKILPSLLVGTRGVLASVGGYLNAGPRRNDRQFREILTMPADGATIAVDYELPVRDVSQRDVLEGPIRHPVVLILHGMNNDSNFGYVRATMRACTEKGWIAVAMNLRGCGGIPLTTPRNYNGAYTGDIRYTVLKLSGRMEPGVPLFLVGNSLGANLVAKYLGEEGLSNTLPACVAGGITLGNPMGFDSRKAAFGWSQILMLGAQKSMYKHLRTLSKMTAPSYRQAIRTAMTATSLARFDEALTPVSAHNETTYPFAFKVGYRDGKEYWKDASSYHMLPHVSVPLLQVVARDDFLVYGPFRAHMRYSLVNPNVLVLQTRCGGHLGWQESPPNGNIFGFGTSWADVALTDFIQAILDHRRDPRSHEDDAREFMQRDEAHLHASSIRSKL